ncbi:type 2 DNA topoisomerase 6 subunit B-like [Synchiropus picturatus]
MNDSPIVPTAAPHPLPPRHLHPTLHFYAASGEMLQELRQVLRAFALLAPKRQSGGLLVIVWSQAEGHGQKCCCTVVATGGWHKKMSEKNLQAALTDINKGILPNLLWSVMPDPEEVRRFSNLYGPVKSSLTFQMKDVRISPECQAHVESFLHTFSLVNAAIEVQLIINLSLQKFRRSFRAKFRSRVSLPDQPPVVLDATCVAIPHVCVGGGPWCARGHAVLGSKVPLSIPLQVMDRGLFGELNAQLVLLLTPCMHVSRCCSTLPVKSQS